MAAIPIVPVESKEYLSRRNIPTLEDVNPHFIYHPETSATSTHIFVGASSSGKTSLMARVWEVLFKDTHITIAFLGNPAAASNNVFRYAMFKGKKIVLVDGYEPQILAIVKLIAEKTFRIKNFKFCLIFDDILQVHDARMVNELMMSLRNVGISTMISIQYPKMLSPAQRGNAYNVWLGGFHLPEQELALYKSFVGGGIDYETFKRATQDHGFVMRDTVHDKPWAAIRLSPKIVASLQEGHGREPPSDSSSSSSESDS